MSAESKPRLKILLTGFGPFNQRLVNGSWLGVRQFIAESFECNGVRCEIVATQCTVDWGAPTEQVLPVVRAYQPDIVLSFGEAKDNFRIECLARKLRHAQRKDNLGMLPQRLEIADGEEQYTVCFDATRVKQSIDCAGLDVPVEISKDCGQFLCEEMLYTMEHHRRRGTTKPLRIVAFLHIPIFNTPIARVSTLTTATPSTQVCDEALLKRFVEAAIRTFVEEYKQLQT